MENGIALCELIFDHEGNPIDYRFLEVNTAFEKQLNMNPNSIVGKTIKEIQPDIKQPLIDNLGAVVLKKKKIQFIEFNPITKNEAQITAYSKTGNNFILLVDATKKETKNNEKCISLAKENSAKVIANKELVFQNENIIKRAKELEIVNKELVFQNKKKVKHAQKLAIINKELALQNKKKEKRAKELAITNEELAFQHEKKERRAFALSIENKELTFQNDKKEKRATEIFIRNKKLELKKREKEKKSEELFFEIQKEKKIKLLKSVFLSSMSHEIRTPMNGIVAFSELLKNPELTNEQQEDYIRIIEKFGNNILIKLDFLADSFKPSFTKFEDIIQKNIHKNLSVNEFAILCNMSPSSFKRKFRDIYTESPIKYLMKIKLEKASKLLKNKNKQISNIAYDLGFHSITSFNRSFKSYYGKTPSKYRLD